MKFNGYGRKNKKAYKVFSMLALLGLLLDAAIGSQRALVPVSTGPLTAAQVSEGKARIRQSFPGMDEQAIRQHATPSYLEIALNDIWATVTAAFQAVGDVMPASLHAYSSGRDKFLQSEQWLAARPDEARQHVQQVLDRKVEETLGRYGSGELDWAAFIDIAEELAKFNDQGHFPEPIKDRFFEYCMLRTIAEARERDIIDHTNRGLAPQYLDTGMGGYPAVSRPFEQHHHYLAGVFGGVLPKDLPAPARSFFQTLSAGIFGEPTSRTGIPFLDGFTDGSVRTHFFNNGAIGYAYEVNNLISGDEDAGFVDAPYLDLGDLYLFGAAQDHQQAYFNHGRHGFVEAMQRTFLGLPAFKLVAVLRPAEKDLPPETTLEKPRGKSKKRIFPPPTEPKPSRPAPRARHRKGPHYYA